MSTTDEFSGSIGFKTGRFDPSVLHGFEYSHLLIRMDDGKPSDAFRKAYPTIKTIIFEVNGKRYEYDAERFLALLDWWKKYGHALMDERMGEVDDGRP